jgi:putative heme-binding domain-containing protein
VRAIGQVEPPAALTDGVRQALQSLLANPATTAAALPVVTRWDRAHTLASAADARGRALVAELRAAATAPPGPLSDDRRVELAASLLAVPVFRAEALSLVSPMLVDAGISQMLRERLIVTVGDAAGADADAVLIEALARTASTAVFNQLLRRPESALALVGAFKRGAITAAALDPAAVARLRNHPNKQVASEATAYLDSAASSARARSDIIAALLPAVEQPGNATRGRDLFAAACATCHKLGGLGATDVGPPLDGMGAHPPSELLTHILDPNRQVDPSFWQVNVTTRRGETMAGVVASENATTLTLRNPSGSVEIAKTDILTRETTRRSLMPEGLDALGADALRDILTFMAQVTRRCPRRGRSPGRPAARRC